MNHGQLQQPAPGVGAFSKDEAPVAFTAACWSWIRGQRSRAPGAEEYGLTYSQAAGLIRQITMTDEYRRMRK